MFPDTHPHMLFCVRMYILCSVCTDMTHAEWDAPRMWPSWLKTCTERVHADRNIQAPPRMRMGASVAS